MTALNDVTLAQVAVLDSTMAYREAGNADSPTVLFLHGSRTSSHIWRNIIPLVAPVTHCIAPDLIGFGQSGKPDVECRFFDHVRYLDAFLDKAGISSAYVVAHDWGAALAFLLAARRPEFVRALAFMEFIRPMPTWNDFDTDAPETFKKFRRQGVGERKSRRPKWRRFPNDLPIAGEPADMHSAIRGAYRALGSRLTQNCFSPEIPMPQRGCHPPSPRALLAD
jgi:haloalkane dehalogenase